MGNILLILTFLRSTNSVRHVSVLSGTLSSPGQVEEQEGEGGAEEDDSQVTLLGGIGRAADTHRHYKSVLLSVCLSVCPSLVSSSRVPPVCLLPLRFELKSLVWKGFDKRMNIKLHSSSD